MADVTDTTNPTIFLRLKSAEAQPRQFAWNEFHARYAPIIAGFARRLGGKPQDVDDVVQDVLMGFFAKAPTFVYDPSQGRFRGYLKVCAVRALQRRLGKAVRAQGQALDDVDPGAVAVEQVWEDVWQQEKLRRALAELKAQMAGSRTFDAFEQYVVFGKPAQEVADALGLHVNSVYRAKEQLTTALQEKLRAEGDDE